VNGWTRLQMFKRALRPRVLIYGAVLSAASIAFAASVAMRSPFKFDVVKDRGALARVVEDGAVENVYRIQIMNRTEAPQTYRVAASGIDGLEVVATPASAGPAAVASSLPALRREPAPAQRHGRGPGRSRPVGVLHPPCGAERHLVPAQAVRCAAIGVREATLLQSPPKQHAQHHGC
jgi:hypothetical protein